MCAARVCVILQAPHESDKPQKCELKNKKLGAAAHVPNDSTVKVDTYLKSTNFCKTLYGPLNQTKAVTTDPEYDCEIREWLADALEPR